MSQLVHQIGELFLRAMPVSIVVLLFYFILRSVFFKPLLKVMAERDARTLGAQKTAEAAQTAAAETIRQYKEALKQARAAIYLEQEAERKKVLDERAAVLKDARAKAAGEVLVAKERVAEDIAAAKKELESTTGQLAAAIAHRVLQNPPSPGSPARDPR